MPCSIDGQVVCGDCHERLRRKVQTYAEPKPQQSPIFDAPDASPARIYYQDDEAIITDQGVEVRNRQFPMATIRGGRIQIIPPDRRWALALAGVTVLIVIFIVLERLINQRFSWALAFLGLITTAMAAYQFRDNRAEYGFAVDFSMKERVLVHTQDRARAEAMVSALQQARRDLGLDE